MRVPMLGRWMLSVLAAALAAAEVHAAIVDDPPAAQPPTAADAATATAPDTKAIENDELRKVWKAMAEADTITLFDLYASKDPIVHAFAAMAIERTRFNLDAASKIAQTCEEALQGEKKFGLALSCAQFRVGNLTLAGKRREAADLEAQLIQRYRGHVADKAIVAMQADLERDWANAHLSFERPDTDVVLPTRRDKPSPTFAATANGHEFDLTLDSGATGLVLGERDAEQLGIKALDEKGKLRGWIAKDVPAQRGVLDLLQIGALTLRNVPVTIVPRRFALIGADLLAPFGALRVTRQDLTIYGPRSSPPSCERPMQIGSGPWGRWLRVLPEFTLNDQPHRVQLDTGAWEFLLGTKAALDEVTQLRHGRLDTSDIGGVHQNTRATAAKVPLTIDRQPFKIYFIVYDDSEAKHDITLGAGALKDMDFVLDFRDQKLCFAMHPDLHSR